MQITLAPVAVADAPDPGEQQLVVLNLTRERASVHPVNARCPLSEWRRAFLLLGYTVVDSPELHEVWHASHARRGVDLLIYTVDRARIDAAQMN